MPSFPIHFIDGGYKHILTSGEKLVFSFNQDLYEAVPDLNVTMTVEVAGDMGWDSEYYGVCGPMPIFNSTDYEPYVDQEGFPGCTFKTYQQEIAGKWINVFDMPKGGIGVIQGTGSSDCQNKFFKEDYFILGEEFNAWKKDGEFKIIVDASQHVNTFCNDNYEGAKVSFTYHYMSESVSDPPSLRPSTSSPSPRPSTSFRPSTSLAPSNREPSVSVSPSAEPTVAPSAAPSVEPTIAPSKAPTIAPTPIPVVVTRSDFTCGGFTQIMAPDELDGFLGAMEKYLEQSYPRYQPECKCKEQTMVIALRRGRRGLEETHELKLDIETTWELKETPAPSNFPSSSAIPTDIPTPSPTTAMPTPYPTSAPTTAAPTVTPGNPTAAPTTSAPTASPSSVPSVLPTLTVSPTSAPSPLPTSAPTPKPTDATVIENAFESAFSSESTVSSFAEEVATVTGVNMTVEEVNTTGIVVVPLTPSPSSEPSFEPSSRPSTEPSLKPTVSSSPSSSLVPSSTPSVVPSLEPTSKPSLSPVTKTFDSSVQFSREERRALRQLAESLNETALCDAVENIVTSALDDNEDYISFDRDNCNATIGNTTITVDISGTASYYGASESIPDSSTIESDILAVFENATLVQEILQEELGQTVALTVDTVSVVPDSYNSAFDWNIEKYEGVDVAFNDDTATEEIIFKYKTSKKQYDITIFENDCETKADVSAITYAVDDTEEAGTYKNLTIKVDIDQANITGSSYWNYTSTDNSTGTIKFCLRLDLVLDDGTTTESVHFYETVATIDIDMKAGFSVSDVGTNRDKATAKNETTKLNYTVSAYQCDPIDLDTKIDIALSQGSVLSLCIKTNSTADVYVGTIYELNLTQTGTNANTQPIKDGAVNELTSLNCETGTCLIKTQMLAQFFALESPNLVVSADGIAVLAFGTSGRRLGNVRLLETGDDDESTDFNLQVALQPSVVGNADKQDEVETMYSAAVAFTNRLSGVSSILAVIATVCSAVLS